MGKRSLFTALFLLAIAGAGFAQAFVVSYLDGVVDVQIAKGWKALAIGDSLPADATVRISQNGSLELQRGKTKITLLKDGVYDMAVLSKSADKAGAGGVGSAITQKLQALVTEKPKASTAGGVRGAEQGSASVTWVDESDETRTQVEALLDKKQYADAVTALNDAIDNSMSDADTQEFTYLLGVAYYGAGQTAKAYRALAQVTASPDAAWYARYVVLKAQVLVDTANYSDALALLTPFITAYPTGEATQVAYLLTAFCRKGLGDQAAASAALDAGYKLDPSTDTAKLIDQQRKAQ